MNNYRNTTCIFLSSMLLLGTVGAGIAQAATFVEEDLDVFDTGELITTAKGLIGADIDTIEANFSDVGDVDLYHLRFDVAGHLNVQFFYAFEGFDSNGNLVEGKQVGNRGLYLFDSAGHALKFSQGTIDFDIVADQSVYLGIANLKPLNTNGEVLFDPSHPDLPSNGTLGGWDRENLAFPQVVIPYSLSLQLEPDSENPQATNQTVPEPSTIAGLVFLGILVTKVQKRQNKS